MKRLLRRWLGLESPAKPPAPPQRAPSKLHSRVARLEERMDFLEEALNRLRGRVTGAEAHKPKPKEDENGSQPHQDAPGPTIGTPPIADPGEDRWVSLARHRRAKNAVLPR